MTVLLNNRFFVIFFVPFLLGALATLGFSPYSFTFINFFSFSILLFLILIVKKRTQSNYRKKKSKHYFFYLGCAFGFGFFLLGNYWISISLTHDEMFKDLIPLSLILIPLFLSLFFGLAILVVGPFSDKSIHFILFFSLVFSIFEFLRGNLLTGFPWNLISYTWSWSIESIQILSSMGAYSLSLISLTFFCIPFLFFQNKIIKKNVIFLIIFLIIFIGNYSYGLYKISKSSYDFDRNINVKIVSPNFSLKDYSTQSEIDQLKRLIQISDPEKNKKTLFIWPEGIFYESNLQNIALYKNLFINKFSENHLIVLGVNNLIKLDSEKYFNSLLVVDKNLNVISQYDKKKLVPFGEFLPFEKFFNMIGIKKITPGYSSFSKGNTKSVIKLKFDSNNISLLSLICYEIIFPHLAENNKNQFNFIINISDDAWFGDSIGPHQHFAKAIFRSIESKTYTIRSANRGISAFLNPNGKILKSLKPNEIGNIELDLPIIKTTNDTSKKSLIFLSLLTTYILAFFVLRKFKL